MIKIITDSTCDLPIALLEKYNIKSLPITIELNDKIYKDKVDITNEEFYNAIKDRSVCPKTAQVNPAVFEDAFKEELDKGNEVICITISSKLSGTYNSAYIAKSSLESDKIHLIDSKGASMSYGLLVIEVAKMIKDGKDIPTIIREANDFILRQESIVCVDTLEMLKRSGRLSSSSAIVGNLLDIKPIIEFRDGELVATGKTRGKKKAFKHIINAIKNADIDEGVDFYIAHSNDIDGCTEFIRMLNNEDLGINVKIAEIGASVGAHLGQGAIAVFFAKK